MSTLPILMYPHPLLREKSKKIEVKKIKSPEIKELILDMLETLEKANGLGLAAPQIGELLRICLIKFEGKAYVLINPRLSRKSFKKEVAEEGCLSFPGQFLPIKRSRKVKVTAWDRNGEKTVLSAEGLLARAFQHEIDHLDGVLFIDRKK